jgi:hypothetical protein
MSKRRKGGGEGNGRGLDSLINGIQQHQTDELILLLEAGENKRRKMGEGHLSYLETSRFSGDIALVNNEMYMHNPIAPPIQDSGYLPGSGGIWYGGMDGAGGGTGYDPILEGPPKIPLPILDYTKPDLSFGDVGGGGGGGVYDLDNPGKWDNSLEYNPPPPPITKPPPIPPLPENENDDEIDLITAPTWPSPPPIPPKDNNGEDNVIPESAQMWMQDGDKYGRVVTLPDGSSQYQVYNTEKKQWEAIRFMQMHDEMFLFDGMLYQIKHNNAGGNLLFSVVDFMDIPTQSFFDYNSTDQYGNPVLLTDPTGDSEGFYLELGKGIDKTVNGQTFTMYTVDGINYKVNWENKFVYAIDGEWYQERENILKDLLISFNGSKADIDERGYAVSEQLQYFMMNNFRDFFWVWKTLFPTTNPVSNEMIAQYQASMMALEWMNHTKGPEYMMNFLKDNPDYMMAFNLLYPIIPILNPKEANGQNVYEQYLNMTDKEKNIFKISYELTYLMQDSSTMDILLNAPGVSEASDRFQEGLKISQNLKGDMRPEDMERLMMDFSNLVVAILSVNPTLMSPEKANQTAGFFNLVKTLLDSEPGETIEIGAAGSVAYMVFALYANKYVLAEGEKTAVTFTSSMLQSVLKVFSNLKELATLAETSETSIGANEIQGVFLETSMGNMLKAIHRTFGSILSFVGDLTSLIYDGIDRLLMGFLSQDVAPFAKHLGKQMSGAVFNAAQSVGLVEEEAISTGHETWLELFAEDEAGMVYPELETVIYGEGATTWVLTEGAVQTLGAVGGAVFTTLNVGGLIYTIYIVLSTIRDMVGVAEKFSWEHEQWKKIEKNLGKAYQNAMDQANNSSESQAYQMWKNYDKLE